MRRLLIAVITLAAMLPLASPGSAALSPSKIRYVCNVKAISFLHVPGEVTEVHDGSGGIPLMVDVTTGAVSVDEGACDPLPWTVPAKVKPATWKARSKESVVSCTFPLRMQFWVQKTPAGYTTHLGYGGKAYAMSRHTAVPLVSWNPKVCLRGT